MAHRADSRVRGFKTQSSILTEPQYEYLFC